MKMYATTTTERASKGQGGNEYLRVEMLVGNAKEHASIGIVELLPTGDNRFTLYYRYNGKSIELKTLNLGGTVFATKGEKKKDEYKPCMMLECGGIAKNGNYCPRHLY